MTSESLNRNCSGPIKRRSFLEIGGLSVLGLGMSDFLRYQAEVKAAGDDLSDTSVIFVWLPGGPPHMETYDMKPQAPSEYRGDFNPIHTIASGLDVCELLPMHAKVADKSTLIRSIHHNFADQGGGHKRLMTGRIPVTPVGTVNDARLGVGRQDFIDWLAERQNRHRPVLQVVESMFVIEVRRAEAKRANSWRADSTRSFD